MSKFQSLFAVIIFSGLLSACMANLDNGTPAYGMVYGVVTIGPLCPVEPCQLTEDQIDDIYAARKIIIYREDTSTVVQTVSIDDDRYYRAYLLPGNYVVDINREGIDHSSNVPVAIKLGENESLRIDIDIDTGIR